MRNVRILLTGFGAFPGAPVNPTQAIVRAVQTRHRRELRRTGIELRTAILPVVYAEVEPAIVRLLGEHRPDIVLHLGLAGRRRVVSIETRAKNRLSIIHPDAKQAFAANMRIEAGGEATIPARWPAQRLAAAVSRNAFAAKPSIDAGDYLCNQALHMSLRLHAGLCGFIHVPPVRSRRPAHHRLRPARRLFGSTRAPLPALAQLERSVMTAIRLLAAEHRRTGLRKQTDGQRLA